MKTPPKVKGAPVTGNLSQLKRDPIRFMHQAVEQYGDIHTISVFGKKIIVLNHPDYVKHVLQTNYKNYDKSPSYKVISLWGGNGILMADGEEWLKRRKLYQPAFTNTSIQSYTSLVINNAQEMCDYWSEEISKDKDVNISMEMTKVTLSVISESLFSKKVELGSELWEDITYAIEWIGNRILRRPFVLPENFPSASNKRFHMAVSNMEKLIYEIIESKKSHNENPNDLLSRFMDPEDKKLQPFNEKELRDEVMTLFVAGHETSANVLSWTYYMLATNPEIQEKVFVEVSNLGDKTLAFEDMHQLNYVVQVLSETMRMFPPVWHMGRLNLQDDEIGGYLVPKGSHIRISPLTLHRHKEFYDNPEVFNPDRFETEKAKEQVPFSYIPFGAGPRLCAGRNFAMMEMVLILAETCRQFRFSYKGPVIEMAPMMTLRSKGDIKLKVTRR